MNVIGSLGRNIPQSQNPVESEKSVQYNQYKVKSKHCNNQVRKSNAALSKTNKTLTSRKISALKNNQLNPDKLPKSFSTVAKRGFKAKSAEGARNSIKDYFQLLRQTYSREAPPSLKVREQLYNDVVKLSAKVMSFEFTAGRDGDKGKMIGLTAELLQQMETGLETSSADFVNSQVTGVLSLGMMTQEDKEFLFSSCLNTQIISVDKYTADIENLDRRTSKLNVELADAKPEEVDALKSRIKNAGLERSCLVKKRDQLVSKEEGGMHGQKEFFQSCYKIIMNEIRSEIRAGLTKQIKHIKQKNKKNVDVGTELARSIMEKMDSTIRSKSESIAKNAANVKKGVQAEEIYQQKKTGLLLLLNKEISELLGKGEKDKSDLKSNPVHENDSPRPHVAEKVKAVGRENSVPEASKLSTSVMNELKEALKRRK